LDNQHLVTEKAETFRRVAQYPAQDI